MKKIYTLVLLLVVFATDVKAQTAPPPMCGWGHTDVVTGQFVCDDPQIQSNELSVDEPSESSSESIVILIAETLAVIRFAIR